jgi:5S rRNA maturation endonuclease (ribonuclease M5)
MQKIHCVNPNHNDENASMHLYEETAYCFACNFTIPIEEVLNEEEIKKIRKETRPKEDIQAKLREIKTHPIKRIRGLSLHSGPAGYWILWPDNSFYKFRTEGMATRYIGPRGHKPPLFRCRPEPADKKIIIIVEGELNALSLDLGINSDNIHIVSPGSAGNLVSYISYYIRYDTVFIIVDYDKPGVDNGDKLRKELLSRKKRCRLIAVHEDFNELLQRGGVELVKREFMKELGFV